MRKALFFIFASASALFISCNSSTEKTAATTSEGDTTMKVAVNLPFQAMYSSNFTDDVSDADLVTVMESYKHWADGNITAFEQMLADSVEYDASSGFSKKMTKAEIMNVWKTYRDSLSSVKIDMYAWRKMYAADKKEPHVVVWYKEIDTYKDGRIDSALYHDINGLKDGKISWYSSMKRGYMK